MSLLAAAVLSCVPALPFYCGNIHIGCAERTRVATDVFRVSDQRVTFENATDWQVRSHADRGAIVLRRIDNNDWIRIEADGRFSLRRYRDGRALMTRGTCERGSQD